MKYLGNITNDKDIVNKEYVDNAVAGAGGGGLTKEQIVDFIYPVGSLFISTTSTNPTTYLGGTWVRWGQGRVPVSVSDSDSDFGANKTGGEKTHTLSMAEMPLHSHEKGALATSDAGEHTHTISGTAASTGAHEHSVSGTAASAGAHTHKGYYRNKYNTSSSNLGLGTSSTTGVSGTNSQITNSTGAHEHSVSGTAASAGAHTHDVSGTAASAGSHSHTITGSTASAGTGIAHNNLPPYITCYMWQRTA